MRGLRKLYPEITGRNTFGHWSVLITNNVGIGGDIMTGDVVITMRALITVNSSITKRGRNCTGVE
jgi:hypothetical protein